MINVAVTFPATLTTVRPISTKRSIPAIKARPETGTPIVETVANKTTNDAPGTPAIPLEVIIKTNNKVNC